MKPSYVSRPLSSSILYTVPLRTVSVRRASHRALFPCCSNEPACYPHGNRLDNASVSMLCVFWFFFFSISVVSHLRVLSYASVRILGRFVFCLSCRVSLRGSTVPGLLHCSVRIPPGADAVRSHLKSAQGRRALFARLDFLPCCLLSSPNTSFVLCYAFHAERTAAVF